MYDTDIDWVTYLEALERQAIRLDRLSRKPRRSGLIVVLARLLPELRLTRVGGAGKDPA
jgi:hypothetical protein